MEARRNVGEEKYKRAALSKALSIQRRRGALSGDISLPSTVTVG
jgi:hypothetical protein